MKRLVTAMACVLGCAPPVPVVSIANAPAATTETSQTPRPRDASAIVVTGAPYARIALWRAFASGRIEPVPFPWADLSIIDSLKVSPDGAYVAYVEGGTKLGPVVVRAIADGAKTTVAPHEAGLELVVVAWSPDGRKVLYATKRPHELASSYFVFDRSDARAAKADVPGEFVAWLPSGEIIVMNDDAVTTHIDPALVVSNVALDVPRGRLLASSWKAATHTNEILAIDLATWNQTPIAPPAAYATYGWPKASASGRVAWLSYDFKSRTEALVASGKAIAGPSRDLVGFQWIDDTAMVAHYRDRIDVIDAHDGKTKVTQATGADDIAE